MKKFTLKTLEGSRRLLVLFLVLILAFGFVARLIESDMGKIKIEKIHTDLRGGMLDGELYYPAGTGELDKLPGIVTTHGGACTYGISKLFAEELARRGFVVFNISSYGYGYSEKATWDDLDPDIKSKGLNDALNYLRGLRFVDSTRLGLTGHSMGSLYSGYASTADAGYYTLNDLNLNTLYDHFGVEISVDELYSDAASIAAAKLNVDQLKMYELLAAENAEYYNSRLKTVVCLGTGATAAIPQSVVTVAGHEVSRSLQCNVASMFGSLDHIMNAWNFGELESNQAAFYITGEEIADSTWYVLNDETATSETVGVLFQTDAASNTALAEAAAGRDLRIKVTFSNMTHSKEFFSTRVTTAMSEIFTQTLNYNNGELGAADASPVPSTSNTWQWRAVCNGLSMIFMLAMLVALVSMLTKTKRFEFGTAPVTLGNTSEKTSNAKAAWVINIITVVVGVGVFYYSVNHRSVFFSNSLFRFYTTMGNVVYFLLGTGILGLIFYFYNKKKGNARSMKELGLNLGLKNILKAFGMAGIVGAVGYLSLMILDYLFGQDYRFWMSIFTYMRPEWWIYCIPYAVILLPLYLISGIGINHSLNGSSNERKDLAITIVVNSLGVWILCLLNFMLAMNNFDGTMIANFITSYQYLILVPITVYITRKLYLCTGSIWHGALLNTFLICWTHASETGLKFGAQTWLSNFFN